MRLDVLAAYVASPACFFAALLLLMTTFRGMC
jgi:hypothetical protein